MGLGPVTGAGFSSLGPQRSLQCSPYRASLPPEPPGCMLPAGCWLAAAGTCQRDGHLQTPRNRRHSQQKRCPRCMSAKKQPSLALTSLLPESSDSHRVVILHLRAEGNFLTRRFDLQGSMEAQAPGAAYFRVWPGAGQPGKGEHLQGSLCRDLQGSLCSLHSASLGRSSLQCPARPSGG